MRTCETDKRNALMDLWTSGWSKIFADKQSITPAREATLQFFEQTD